MLALPISPLQCWLFVALSTVFFVMAGVTLVSIAIGSRFERGAMPTVVGILVQSLAMGVAGFGPLQPTLAPFSVLGLAGLVAALSLFGAFLWLIVATSRALRSGQRPGADAQNRLVRVGPYAIVRHPMYAALLIYLIALAVAAGHVLHLIVAVPVFLVGSLLRIRAEEKVLEGEFGDEFGNYRRSTPALIPWTLINRWFVRMFETRDE